MTKVRIGQWKGIRIDQRKMFNEVRISQWKKVRISLWSGSELAIGRGPNWLGPNKIGSELTRAELASPN